ncbi:hypothetical protein ENHY17A_110277 [Moraxellaceae bacterium 17A]|nr:hypothetical protein ENHY17A_110277 [Moraxellaceae bacterium 17A]
MKLDDFLECKKVRCVKGYDDCLKIGKEYNVIDISVEIKVKDDEGEFLYWESDHFEPVIDELSKSAENPLQDMKLTPEFEAVEPKFKVGDKAYVGLTGRIARVTEIIDDDVVSVANKNNEVRAWISNICHATPENYERLQATFPDIEFEHPPKELKGSDLARAMFDKGWKFVPCYVSVDSDESALKDGFTELVTGFYSDGLFSVNRGCTVYAVPFDSKTGEPLTESILND